MLTDEQHAALEAAWAPARRAGVLGTASLEALVEHTAGFVRAVCSSFSADAHDLDASLIDVGTGAGVPGILLALALPRAHVTLLDASERRLDHVRRAARAVGVTERVTVIHGRADAWARSHGREGYDVAVARLLADPAEALEQLVPLVRDGGVVVVATAADVLPRWRALPVGLLPTGSVALTEEPAGWFAAVERRGPLAEELPRREKIRRRSPAF